MSAQVVEFATVQRKADRSRLVRIQAHPVRPVRPGRVGQVASCRVAVPARKQERLLQLKVACVAVLTVLGFAAAAPGIMALNDDQPTVQYVADQAAVSGDQLP